MPLVTQINTELKEAMKAREAARLSTLRMLTSALKNEAINLKKKDEELSDEEAVKVIKSEVKKRKDSIQSYEEGGRADLADSEKAEVVILEKYLPAQMSSELIREKVSAVLATLDEDKKKNFGAVMGLVMKEVGQAADGNQVRQIIQELTK